MLAWLGLILSATAAALSGHPALAERIDATPGAPAAILVTGALSALYLLTLRQAAEEDGGAVSRIAPLLALMLAAVASVPALKSAGLWPWRASVDGSNPSMVTTVQPTVGRAAVRLRRDAGGRFVAQATVNGAALRVIVDTGAAAIVLKATDAEAAGVDVSRLAFDAAMTTASGDAYYAPVRLREVTVGPIVVADVEGFVARPGSLNESLLGMSFLRRLGSYDLAGEFMTLRQ